MGFLVDQVQLFLLALQRFACLRTTVDVTAEDRRRALRYWPLVGMFVGLLCGLVFVGTARWFPPAIAVLFALGAGLFLTRATHERDLFHTGESLLPGLGAVLCNFLLLLQFSALAYQQEGAMLAALLCGHSFSRFAVLPLTVRMSGVKPDLDAAETLGPGEFLSAAFYGLLPLVALVNNRFAVPQLRASLLIAAGAALAVTAFVGWRLLRYLEARGETMRMPHLGALQQCAGTAFYLCLLIAPR